MRDVEKYTDPIKFRPNYSWPKAGTTEHCPNCGEEMQLVENRPEYFGKPWWCSKCKWQYSQEDLYPPKKAETPAED